MPLLLLGWLFLSLRVLVQAFASSTGPLHFPVTAFEPEQMQKGPFFLFIFFFSFKAKKFTATTSAQCCCSLALSEGSPSREQGAALRPELSQSAERRRLAESSRLPSTGSSSTDGEGRSQLSAALRDCGAEIAQSELRTGTRADRVAVAATLHN